MVFVRIERSGTGDSEGAPCSAIDYDTEVRHYREAFDQIARHPWVDPARIIIFGNSLGSTTAPLVAQGNNVAGIAVQGGGALTYLERMIHFDRLYLERSGKYRPEQIHEEMSRRIPFHVEYLINGKTPEQIERERPDLRGVWQSIRGAAEAPPHYGRPYAWHQQAAKKDFLEAWTKVEAPVLVIYGEYDQFESRHGHELIANAVNKLRPGSATFIEVPKADHEIELYASAEDAYAYRNPTVRPELLVRPLIEWAKRVTSR
jgi:pimeloyl-ACP methyl ester carboxylesterase